MEIVGLDISELGGLSQDIYNKLKTEYGKHIEDVWSALKSD